MSQQTPAPTPPPTWRERTQNFLLYGFAISVALHLIVGPFIKFERAPDAPEKIETVKIDKMPTPPPTPRPTPTPLACANPNVPAKTINTVQPDTPSLAQQQGISGEVTVLVSLDENSKLVGLPTVQKSPSALLNKAAIDAARQTTYQTEIRNCKPIAATYRFIVEFTSQ